MMMEQVTGFALILDSQRDLHGTDLGFRIVDSAFELSYTCA